MADKLSGPQGDTQMWKEGEDREVPEETWEQAVLDGDAAPAPAGRFPIRDLQHWIDLSA
jgi:hypothetical protein